MRTSQWIAVLFIPLILLRQMVWSGLTEDEQNEAPIELKAYVAGMTVEEFQLMSAVVEAESDRSDEIEGKMLIALAIFNRVDSSKFPNSIKGVISEAGQFQVYYDGIYKSVGRTDSSDRAVIEASFWRMTEHPNVIYFNCIGYNYLGTPYDYVGGNYFETLEDESNEG